MAGTLFISSLSQISLAIVYLVLRAIQLDYAVRFHHYGGKEYQCEVALLSRRIFVYGNGTIFNGFGGHIMIM